MPPFHKILVPTDFSKHSIEAVQVAAALSKLCAAPLTIMTVYQPLILPMVPEGAVFPTPEAMAADYQRTREQLEAAVAQATGAGAPSVDSLLADGAPFAQIVACAREGAFDLIVMGTHGRTGLKHALLGSVAEKVVRKAPCAVLTVRLPATASSTHETSDAS